MVVSFFEKINIRKVVVIFFVFLKKNCEKRFLFLAKKVASSKTFGCMPVPTIKPKSLYWPPSQTDIFAKEKVAPNKT